MCEVGPSGPAEGRPARHHQGCRNKTCSQNRATPAEGQHSPPAGCGTLCCGLLRRVLQRHRLATGTQRRWSVPASLWPPGALLSWDFWPPSSFPTGNLLPGLGLGSLNLVLSFPKF